MFTKLCRDEVLVALHVRKCFSARSALRWIQGRAKIDQLGAPSPMDFFLDRKATATRGVNACICTMGTHTSSQTLLLNFLEYFYKTW